MEGFPAKSVVAVRSRRVVCVVQIAEVRVKAFQVGFEEDGSLFIHFPYFRHRTGILSSSEIPASGERSTDVNLENGGKVTSHLVKYSHHPDGRAHFSQDGKIFTAIKRQSIPLDSQHGHLFTLNIQGLPALKDANQSRDADAVAAERSVISFPFDRTPDAIKFVGRWLDINKIRVSEPDAVVGPRHPMLDPDGVRIDGILLANPKANTKHVLAISCVTIPKLSPELELFQFHGGFDPPETMTDATKTAGFLAFLYPILDASNVRERVGSVDYIP
jgi:hypothetical protein